MPAFHDGLDETEIPQTEDVVETDVLIVGSGPAGSSAALFLSTLGIRTIMITKYRWTANTPRAHITNQRAMEIFRDMGIEDEVLADATPHELVGDTVFCTSIAGEEIGRIRTWGTRPDREGDYRLASPCLTVDIPQTYLEPILVRNATVRGTESRFATEYLSHVQDEDGVTVRVRDRLTGHQYQVRAAYLIGADGARSMVAADIGLPYEGAMDIAGSMNITFKADISALVDHRPSVLYWVISPGSDVGGIGTGLVRMVRPWDEWLIVWGYDIAGPPPVLDDEAATAIVRELLGMPDLEPEITGYSLWGVNEMYATRLQEGRVFCVGDAVHRHPPSNGLGSNTSIQDSYNLAWKLAAVLRGQAAPSLLDSYTAERAPVAERIVTRANRSAPRVRRDVRGPRRRGAVRGGDGGRHRGAQGEHAGRAGETGRAGLGHGPQELRVQRPRRRARPVLRVRRDPLRRHPSGAVARRGPLPRHVDLAGRPPAARVGRGQHRQARPDGPRAVRLLDAHHRCGRRGLGRRGRLRHRRDGAAAASGGDRPGARGHRPLLRLGHAARGRGVRRAAGAAGQARGLARHLVARGPRRCPARRDGPTAGAAGVTQRFTHRTLPQRVVFAAGDSPAAVREEVAALGAARVMLIASEREAALADPIAAELPLALRHDEVVMHVPVEVARRAREAAADCGADVLVSVGGGSTTGLAKAVALASGLPVVAVPTTYAGSEATDVWGLTEGGTKTTGVDAAVLPASVVYDAALLTSLPGELTVASGLNAMAHCVDSMWGPRADPFDRAQAGEGIRALAAGLPVVARDAGAVDGIEDTLYGAYLAAVAFASAGSGMHHKICHVLGGMFALPHAQTHAVVLPHVLAFNAPNAPAARERIARALDADSAVTGLARLYATLQAPRSLREQGMPEEGIAAAVEPVLAAVPSSNPTPVTAENVTALLRAAWTGEEPSMSSGAAAVSPEQAAREEELVERVRRSFDTCADPRLRQLVVALAEHVHAFIRETRLTEQEWGEAIDFLTRAGHITDDRRQEFILLSDVLGASMQTIAVNNPAHGEATEATVWGPFFVEGSPEIANGGDMSAGAAGEPCWVEGTVTDVGGTPLAGALLEVWEADEDGMYDVQYPDGRTSARAHLRTEEDGSYRFWGITPTPYPIPYDGPVGQLLEAVGRSPMRASHLHFLVSHPGCRTLVTHIFVAGDALLEADSVFGVKDSLVKEFEQQPPGTPTPDGREVVGTWSRTRFDIVLAPATVG